jgi:acetyl esterase/lipase
VYGAIAHIQENAEKYGGDPTRIALTGDSAGGHLCAAAANMPNRIGDKGFGKVAGVYEYKPTYLPENKSIAQVRDEMEHAIKAVAPSYGVFIPKRMKEQARKIDSIHEVDVKSAISPIENIPNVEEREIPQLLLRGTHDGLIKNEMVESYYNALKEAGQKAAYIQVEGANHAFFDWKPDAATQATFAKYGVKYARVMEDFFNEVFY